METLKIITYVMYEGFRYTRTEHPNGIVEWDCISADIFVGKKESGLLEQVWDNTNTDDKLF